MLVSVCTPTFNRRPFIKTLIACFKHQDYTGPMEWIIVDDGTDPVEDLFIEANLPQIKYVRIETKLTLGKKRNLMHSYSKGDILVYMDDDDYYPPQRVSHAVTELTNSSSLIAGSSILHIYFHHISKMVEFGPYKINHATAGTFAFKRELLKQTAYDESSILGEEKAFLKNYTIPMVQLNPKKVILVFSHEHNSFDKRKLLDQKNLKVMHDTALVVSDFIKEPLIFNFFMHEINNALSGYSPGNPDKKQDVCDYIKKMEIEQSFIIQYGNKQLRGNEILQQLNQQQNYILHLTKRVSEQEIQITELKKKICLLIP